MQSEPLIEVRGVSLEYTPGARALDDIRLTFRAGEFAVITGPSGCGKSTLGKCLVGLIPHTGEGVMSGSVAVAGRDTRDHPPCRLADRIALAFQSPDDQIFSNSVEADIAFGPEQMGLGPDEIEDRISRALRETGARGLRHKLTDELSGGEKQRVAIASSLALRPDILVLDEPTSELDPASAFGLIDMLRGLNADHGMTVILIEHRLERLYGIMGRLIVLDKGRVAFDGPPDEVFGHDLAALGVFEPPAVSFKKRFADTGPGDGWRAQYRTRPAKKGECAVSLRGVSFSYPRSGSNALTDVNLEIYRGELLMIMGANGSGKTTLVRHLNGLLRPDGGQVLVEGRDIANEKVSAIAREVGIVFQDPSRQLFAETVFDELAFGPGNLGMAPDVIRSRVDEVAGRLQITGLLAKSPFLLSGGEAQRVAIGSTLTMDPAVVVLDEPTLGLNFGLKEGLAGILCSLTGRGHAVVVVTHDVEFAAAHADRVVVMSAGRVIMDGGPREALTSETLASSASLHLPQAALIGRALGLEGILSVDEIGRGP